MKYLIILFLFFTLFLQAQIKVRPLESLINKQEPAWPELKAMISSANNKVEVLPKTAKQADTALFKAQVTTRSPMGAIIYETGGLLIDGGWIRVLGSGSDKLNRQLMDWNKGKTYTKDFEGISYLLIADDVLGGFYAINAGGLDSLNIGKVFYFAPDNLLWENTGNTYTEFLCFCFNGNLKAYYKGMYWNGWEADLKKINGNQAMSFYPFLCTKEAADINKVSKKVVPVEEVWHLQNQLRKQFVTGK